MSLDTLIAEAKSKCSTRDAAASHLEGLRSQLAEVERRQPEIEDEVTTAKSAYEYALASGAPNARKLAEKMRDLGTEAAELAAKVAGLERVIAAAEKEHDIASRAAAAVVVRIAKIKASAQAETTRALIRQAAESHAKWHAICAGAAAVEGAATDRVCEPIAHCDPGAAMLRGARDRFDEGLESELRASGLASTWGPGENAQVMTERALLEAP